MYQIFVSYVWEERRHRETLERWEREGRIGAVHISGEAQDMRLHGQTAVERHLKAKLEGAAALILLVGDNAHNHEWVAYEANFMLSARKPVVIVRLPDTRGAPPESVMSRPMVALEPEAIRRALGR
jgi:hypothetical protein